MKMRAAAIFVAAAVVVSALAACGGAAEKDVSAPLDILQPNVSDGVPADTSASDGSLCILIDKTDFRVDSSTGRMIGMSTAVGRLIRNAANKYTKAGLGDIEILYVEDDPQREIMEPVEYDGQLDDQMYMMYRQLKEIGTEPDIVIFAPSYTVSNDMVYTEYYKYIKNGDLADLTPFMEDDEAYKSSDYVEAVMDGGKYMGRQLFIPMAYRLTMYGGIEELSAETGVPSPGSFGSFDEFWRQFTAASERTAKDGVPMFTRWPIDVHSVVLGEAYAEATASYYPLYTGEVPMNIETGRMFRDNAAFRTMVESAFLSENYFGEGPHAGRYVDGDGLYWNPTVGLELGSVWPDTAAMLISSNSAGTGEYIYDLAWGTDDGRTLYLAPLPSYDDHKKGVAQIILAMGVSESSDLKREAYDFIMYFLNDEATISGIIDNSSVHHWYSVPVKRSHIASFAADLSGGNTTGGAKKAFEAARDAWPEAVTSVAAAAPRYEPLNMVFGKRFAEVYKRRRDGADLDTGALYDELCDLMDADLAEFFGR